MLATKDEALKMAGYDLDGVIADVEKFDGFDDVCLQTIKRVRSTIEEALEQPAQEPVAWMDSEGKFRKDYKTEIVRSISAVNREIPLYIHPAQPCQECENLKHDLEGYMDANKKLINKAWQGLTEDEIFKIGFMDYMDGDETIEVVREIEAKLKEKNYD